MLSCIYSSDGGGRAYPPELEVICVTGLPARTAKRSCRLFLPGIPSSNPNVLACVCRLLQLSGRGFALLKWSRATNYEQAFYTSLARGLGAFALTAASYAQWSNPADDVPAYHPSAPLKLSALPPILSGSKLSGENFRYPWQVHVYEQVAKVSTLPISSPVIAAATVHLVTPACAAALKDCTALNAPHAPRKAFLPTSRPSLAKLRHKSAPQ